MISCESSGHERDYLLAESAGFHVKVAYTRDTYAPSTNKNVHANAETGCNLDQCTNLES